MTMVRANDLLDLVFWQLFMVCLCGCQSLLQGVLPTPGGVDADGRNGGGDHDTGVRELELQIDALYGMPPSATENRTAGPIRIVQAPVVSFLCVHL